MAKVIACFFFFSSLVSVAQDFHFKQYRVDDGLPSDIIKGCTQDSLGYFWVATDDGLAKYDGIRFTTYQDLFHSGYLKGFFRLKSGRLFAFGDLDLVEIRNLGDTVIFKPVVVVARSPGDRVLSYPKAIYEDTQGNLWISESQSVVRLRGNQFKRFDFDLANRSPQFLRSFFFFEDRQNNLLVSSFQGNVFKFNPSSDEFEARPEKLPFGIEHLSIFESKLLIGCSGGFYECLLPDPGGIGKPELKLNTPFVSFVHALPDGKFFIATRGTKHFIADLSQNSFTPLPNSVNNVNHVYVSRDGDVWLSGNDGLILLRDNLFHQASEVRGDFIESVGENSTDGKIFYTTAGALYSYDRILKKNTELISVPNGYFLSTVVSPEGVWAANAFTVILIRNGEIVKKFDFSSQTRFITDIIKDSKGNLWVAQPGHSFALMIDPSMTLHRFRIPLGKEGVINLIREGKDGMYICSAGKDSYLFYKSNNDSVFSNISAPIKFQTHGDFNVSDIAFIDDQLWLASSEGLLKTAGHSVERIDLGATHTGLSVKAIARYQKNKILFTNAHGLILYDPATQSFDLFNESNGLPSNTITARGLFIGSDNTVWLGTSKALCYADKPLTALKKTPTPLIVDFRADGKKVNTPHQKEIAYGSFIALSVSSITFPEKEVTIQYRLGPRDNWQVSTGSTLNLSDLRSGKYAIEIRAKKNGPFTWSDSVSLFFQIGRPLWQQTWFLLSCVFAAGFLIIMSIVWANVRNNKRRRELELLIDDRTNALRVTNEELFLRNNELDRFVYSASHDLSAPLKSILGLITVAQMENPSPEVNRYLDLMKRSVLKLDSFIRDIISYSRNARLPINKKPVSVDALIESIWADHQYSPNVDKIKFQLVNLIHSEFRSDETRLKIIFNNLISNCIKFHRLDHTPFIKISAAEFPEYFEFKVEDNGMGISPQLKDKIFDMFFRATETVQGSGLGLYILKETLSRLDGTVSVDSVYGEGTTFIITLPK